MDQGIIPVFYHPDGELYKKVIQACANGGAKCIEFTNRGDFAAHVFYEVTHHFAQADPSVIMGVGSVVDAPTAAGHNGYDRRHSWRPADIAGNRDPVGEAAGVRGTATGHSVASVPACTLALFSSSPLLPPSSRARTV